MTGNFSLRDMSYAYVHDFRYHITTSGQTPSHKTIRKFIKYGLRSNIRILFKRIVEVLRKKKILICLLHSLMEQNYKPMLTNTHLYGEGSQKYLKRM